jgi:CPA1 family monovalent cation:H+ antiporter
MPLAAALSIPLATSSGAPLPHRPLVLTLTTGVVVLTLVVQGFTLAPVVRRSGIALEPEHTAREEARARDRLARAGLLYLDQLADLEAAPVTVVDQLRRGLEARLDRNGDETRADHGEDPSEIIAAYGDLRRAVIGVESRELQRLYDTHEIGETTRRGVQRALDLEETGLAE